MNLVVESEPLVERQVGLLQGEHLVPLAQQHHLPVGLVQEHRALAPGQPLVQQVPRHLVVGHSGDQGPGVDEGVVPPLRRRDAVQQAGHRPVLFNNLVAGDGRVRERADHEAVRALLVPAPPQLQRDQVRGRAAEPHAPAEERLAAHLLPAGRDLHHLVAHEGGEDEVLQVPVHHVRQPPQQGVQLPHLVLVRALQQPQRHHFPGVVVLVVLLLVRRGFLPLGDGLGGVVGVVAAAHAAPRLLHPGRVPQRALALAVRARLLGQRLLQRRHQVLKVPPPQALVAVGQDGEADDHVRVGELGRAAGHVLAHKGHRQLRPRPWHVGVGLDRPVVVALVEDAEGHAVDLLQHVRQVAAQPVVRQIKHLLVLGLQVGLHLGRQLRVLELVGPLQQVGGELPVGQAREVLALQPQAQPGGHRRLEPRVVPVRVQQHHVRVALQRAVAVALPQCLSHVLQQLDGAARGAEAHAHAPAGGVEDRVQQVDRQLPPQGGEVQLELLAHGEVELALHGVQDQVHLVHDQHAPAEQPQDLAQFPGVPLHIRVPRPRVVLDQVQRLQELELHALQAGGRGDHHAMRAHCVRQLAVQGGRGLRRAVEGQCVDALLHDAAEGRAHDPAAELQQRGGNHLGHKTAAVIQHGDDEWGDDRGLAAAHDHLLDQGGALLNAAHDVTHQAHLCLS
mmetsp:Transcript_7940/g.13285  ORF Transcript_7940/g.13285 Transcript_7940/m.13285 type:complete len:676 (-) Transcript_7940:52-2079(-)